MNKDFIFSAGMRTFKVRGRGRARVNVPRVTFFISPSS